MIRVDVVLAHASRRCMTCATRAHLAGRTLAGAPDGGAAITTKATYKNPFLSGFLWGCRRATWGWVRGGRLRALRSASPVGEAPSNVSVRPPRGAPACCPNDAGEGAGTVQSRTPVLLRFQVELPPSLGPEWRLV